jgi:hypothetical protein
MAKPVRVDWDYIRARLRERRGGGSYRTLAAELPRVSAQTCHRFLAYQTELDLVSLVCIMGVLELDPRDCFKCDSAQLELMPRGLV